MTKQTPKGGYIALYRKIRENFLWKENRPKTKAEAWIDLCMEARFKQEPGVVVIGMTTLKCQYGECLRSMESWAIRWDWSKSKVKRFFNLLQDCSMIVFKSERVTTRISICNYEVYDIKQNNNEPQSNRNRTAIEPQSNTTNKENKDKNENNEEDPGFVSFDGHGKKHDKPDGTILDKIMVFAVDRMKINDPAQTRMHFRNRVEVKKWLTWAQLYDVVQACPECSTPSDVLLPFEKKLDTAGVVAAQQADRSLKKTQVMMDEQKSREAEWEGLSEEEKQKRRDVKKNALARLKRVLS